jgi:hypothetical protein
VRQYQYQHHITIAGAAAHHAAWWPDAVVGISQSAALASISKAELPLSRRPLTPIRNRHVGVRQDADSSYLMNVKEDAMSKLKKNATSFKKGRKKTGGRKAGTPNKTTRVFREAMLTAAEAAGNEIGGDGLDSYLKSIALNHPTNFFSELARSMPQQLEPEEPDEDVVLHSMEEVREHLTQRGVPPEQLARALLGRPPSIQETAGLTSSTDDHRVEDNASNDSTGGGKV